MSASETKKEKKRKKRERGKPTPAFPSYILFRKVVRRQGMISSPPTLAPVRRNLKIPILTRGWQETVAFLLDEIEPQPPHPTGVLVALNVYIQIITGPEHAVQEPKGERPGDQGLVLTNHAAKAGGVVDKVAQALVDAPLRALNEVEEVVEFLARASKIYQVLDVEVCAECIGDRIQAWV